MRMCVLDLLLISSISYSDETSIRMERIKPPPELDIESLYLARRMVGMVRSMEVVSNIERSSGQR